MHRCASLLVVISVLDVALGTCFDSDYGGEDCAYDYEYYDDYLNSYDLFRGRDNDYDYDQECHGSNCYTNPVLRTNHPDPGVTRWGPNV